MENLSRYFEDKHFIKWIYEPTPELEDWWSQFESNHPEEKNNIRLTSRIIRQFRTSDPRLAEEEKILLFSRVLKQIEDQQQREKKIRILTGFLKYAAVALLFFSIGSLLFYKKNSINPQFFTQNMSEPVPGNTAKLIRSSGEDIDLNDERSVIEHRANGNLLINNIKVKTSVEQGKTSDILNQLIIPYGKTSQVTLSDGTHVFINAGSRFVYPYVFSGNTREVMLIGEAFFDVGKDPDRPFIVQTGDLRIKDLGTRFNVSAYPADNIIETVLADGKVSIGLNDAGIFDKPWDLEPGQLASFNRITNETSIETVNTDNYILWTEGIIKFESAHLSRILKRLERYYNVRFHISDPLLGPLPISGKLELKEDREETIERIARTASVKIIRNGEDYYEVSN